MTRGGRPAVAWDHSTAYVEVGTTGGTSNAPANQIPQLTGAEGEPRWREWSQQTELGLASLASKWPEAMVAWDRLYGDSLPDVRFVYTGVGRRGRRRALLRVTCPEHLTRRVPIRWDADVGVWIRYSESQPTFSGELRKVRKELGRHVEPEELPGILAARRAFTT